MTPFNLLQTRRQFFCRTATGIGAAALASLLGLCPLTDEERAGLFEFIKDDTQWGAISRHLPAKPAPGPSAPAKRSAAKSGAKKSAA